MILVCEYIHIVTHHCFVHLFAMFNPEGWIVKEIWTSSENNSIAMSQLAKNEGYRSIKMKKIDGHFCCWLVKPENLPVLKNILKGENGGLTDREELVEVKGMLARAEITINDLDFVP